MSKLTHESLRQMISEEISKLEASKSEPKSVKVTAKQLRGIILQEVNSLNEQESDEDETKSTVPSDATEIDEHDKKYTYAVNDDGVWFWQKAKGKETAKQFDPVKHAHAIRKLHSWAIKPKNRNTAGQALADLKVLVAAQPSSPESQKLKAFKIAFAAATNGQKNMTKEELMAAVKKVIEVIGKPDFSNIPDYAIEDAIRNSSQPAVVDKFLPMVRQLKKDTPVD
tara:strand:+ start:15310 stop:15984 length:675 start_codon:yes stop_codon:yes gene_type:complete